VARHTWFDVRRMLQFGESNETIAQFCHRLASRATVGSMGVNGLDGAPIPGFDGGYREVEKTVCPRRPGDKRLSACSENVTSSAGGAQLHYSAWNSAEFPEDEPRLRELLEMASGNERLGATVIVSSGLEYIISPFTNWSVALRGGLTLDQLAVNRSRAVGKTVNEWLFAGPPSQARLFFWRDITGLCAGESGVGTDFRRRFQASSQVQNITYTAWIKKLNRLIDRYNTLFTSSLCSICPSCRVLKITLPQAATCAQYEDSIHHPMYSFTYLNQFVHDMVHRRHRHQCWPADSDTL